ncbi:MAG: hypothetical protein QMB48_00875 [Burkholderiaceae bacterium]|jgi:hypothetical protein
MNPVLSLLRFSLYPYRYAMGAMARATVMGACVMSFGMAHAQTASEAGFTQPTIQNTVYVCEQQGVTVLRNTPPTSAQARQMQCTRKTMKTKVAPPQNISRSTTSTMPRLNSAGVPIAPPMWNDPQRTANTLVVGIQVPPNVQWQRDLGRKRILLAELSSAELRLQTLKAEYRDGQPERLGNERNYQKYLDRTAELQQNIRLTEASIAALRREINTIGGVP